MALQAGIVIFALVLSACHSAPSTQHQDGALQVFSVHREPLAHLAVELRSVYGHGLPEGLELAAPEALPAGRAAVVQTGPADVTGAPREASEATAVETEKASASSEGPTTPEGLPDNDQLRRSLFFIGDLPFARDPPRGPLPPQEGVVRSAPGHAEVHEPSREMLPPPPDIVPAEEEADISRKESVSLENVKSAKYSSQLDGLSSFSPVHEKDLIGLLQRPGHRLRIQPQETLLARDAEIRAAMEGEVFQGPPLEPDEVAGLGEGRVKVDAKRNPRTYRWSITTEA